MATVISKLHAVLSERGGGVVAVLTVGMRCVLFYADGRTFSYVSTERNLRLWEESARECLALVWEQR